MKLLENSKFTGAALLLLLALNSVLLVLLVLKKPDTARNPVVNRPQAGGPKDFLIHELNLDAAQTAKYSEMARQHHEKIQRIEADVRQLRDSMTFQLESASPDTAAITRLVKKVGADQVLLDQVTFDHFRELRSICTPEQQARFAKVIRQALHMMRGPQGPRPGQGPQGPPPMNDDGPPPPPEE